MKLFSVRSEADVRHSLSVLPKKELFSWMLHPSQIYKYNIRVSNYNKLRQKYDRKKETTKINPNSQCNKMISYQHNNGINLLQQCNEPIT